MSKFINNNTGKLAWPRHVVGPQLQLSLSHSGGCAEPLKEISQLPATYNLGNPLWG